MNRKLFILLIFLITGPLSHAQYFGRNKVQYENFDFKTLSTDHFNILFYPESQEAVTDAAKMLERWYTRYKKIFVSGIDKDQPIILYANHADFEQTNVISGLIPQGTGGVTEGLRNRIVLPFTGIYEENNHVLGHELVHAFQYNIIRTAPQGMESANQIPLWFIEGMAEYLSLGSKHPLTSTWMRDAVLNNDVPSISDISGGYKYFPYRYGHAVWAYIGNLYGDNIVSSLFSSAFFSGWEDAFKNILKISVDSLSMNWQKSVKDTYSPQLVGRTRPDSTGKNLLNDKEVLSLSPSLSPDGKRIAFLSQRELFTIDLYLADVESGKIIRKLVSSNSDIHFDAISIMNSSGSWSPDGKHFAFMTIQGGDEDISIVNTDNGDFEKNIKIPGADAVYHVSWSPDGNSLLISGGKGGLSDLFIYELNSGSTQQLTNDKYADIQPAWSPNGKEIVFSTDRGTDTDLDSLTFSQLNLATMDLQTKKISILSFSDSAKHIDPHFSPDGKSIYFVSDPDGFSDIYKYSLDDKSIIRLTKVATGIGGLTENSPAISVAGNRIAFTVFNKRNYNLRYFDEAPEAALSDSGNNSYSYHISLPPLNTGGQKIVNTYLADRTITFPKDSSYIVKDYSPKLSLLYLGQPTVGVVFDRFNSGIGGGVSMLFGDMLGNHMLGAAVQIQGTLKDLGGQVLYQNMSHRLNWGVSVGHLPYMTGYVNYGYDTVNVGGKDYLADKVSLIRIRQFITGGSLFGYYPLTTNRRFEISVGYTRIGYDIETENSVVLGGQIISQNTQSLPAPSAIHLFQTSAAYIGDFSYFGFTSPITGSRFRFEVDGTTGTYKFLTLLGDYRKYFFMNPLTFAVRGMHYGRYLGDSETQVLTPLFVGYETFIRGYSVNSFDVSEEAAFSRLVGSRLAVFNAELRVPVFGTEEFGLINFPYLPLELVGFFDGGMAWTKDEKPVLKWSRTSNERIPVFSAGASARVNILGYIVLEFYYAYPFQRPGKSWQFGVNLQPGW